jgi:hypothetical protein
VLHDPNLGYALALGMVVVTGICNIVYLQPARLPGSAAAMKERPRSGAASSAARDAPASTSSCRLRRRGRVRSGCAAAPTASTPIAVACFADEQFQDTFLYSCTMALVTVDPRHAADRARRRMLVGC